MLTLSGKRFVVLPEREYRKLKAKAEGKPVGRSVRGTRRPSTQEAGDIAESKRRLANPRRVPAEDVFRQLGV
jgi:hypothetical protein